MTPRSVPQVIAHRGASRAERENTVAAFHRARQLGADAVELDVRRTLDGALVVHHDAHLDDGRALVALTAGELPAHVPSLAAALDACAGMWVNVEIKNSPDDPDHDPHDVVADGVIDHLRARVAAGDGVGRWLVSSFRRATIDRVHAMWPALPTAWLTVAVPDGAVDDLARQGHRALHPWFGFVTEELVAHCRTAGLALNTWTCDEPDRMRELAAWGVDGICTNVPDLAREVLSGA
jgi:glycerophosphoryl diester phosphodiesterase